MDESWECVARSVKFFQAEGGIRAHCVTGVQTCALPISSARGALVKPHQLLALLEAPQRRGERADVHRLRRHVEEMREQPSDLAIEDANELPALGHRDRSEERRVGKECRSGGSRCQ